MVIIGLIVLVVGWVAQMDLLTIIGLVLMVVGLVLNLVPIGGSSRRVW